MNSILLSIFVLISSIALSTAKDMPAPAPKLIFLPGSVNGKNYLYVNTMGSWDDAKAFCLNSGLKMATVENTAQFHYLRGSPLFKTSNYWLSGRDARSARQFIWDDNETELSNSLVFGDFTTKKVCVAYHANTINANSRLISTLCGDQARFICQTV